MRATSSAIVSAAVPATSWNPKAQVASIERAVGSPSDGYSSAPSTRSRKERRSAQGSSHQSSQSHKHRPSAEVHTRHGAVAEHIARGRVTNVLNPDAHGIKDGVKLHKAATMADFGASAYGGGRASVEGGTKAKARGNGSLLAQRLQQAASAGGDSHEAGRRAWRAKTDLAQKV